MISQFIATCGVRMLFRTKAENIVRVASLCTHAEIPNQEDAKQMKPAGAEYFKAYFQASYIPVSLTESPTPTSVSASKLKSVPKPCEKIVESDSHSDSQSDVAAATEKQELKLVVSSSHEENRSSKNIGFPKNYMGITRINYNANKGTKEVQENSEVPMKKDTPPSRPRKFKTAKFIKKSETLQQLIKLGVQVKKLDGSKELGEFILKLNFEKEVKPYVQFLIDNGVPSDKLGAFLTKIPFILKDSLDDLQKRIYYLQVKKFNKESIASIITRVPKILLLTTKILDGKLGYLQKKFVLSGDELRKVFVQEPKIVMAETMIIETNNAVLEECDFDNEELKHLFLTKPRLWISNQDSLKERFNFIHLAMGFSHQVICQFPGSLLCDKFKMEQRHSYLLILGKAQYEPKKADYVSLGMLIEGTDDEFCKNVAKTSIEQYNEFLASLTDKN